MGEALRLTREQARIYAARSGRKNTARHVYMIDGESLTLAAIAARLGITVEALSERMRVRRKRGDPITWASLESPPSKPSAARPLL